MSNKDLITQWMNDILQVVKPYLSEKESVPSFSSATTTSKSSGNTNTVVHHVHEVHHHHTGHRYSSMSPITTLLAPPAPVVIVNNSVGSSTRDDDHVTRRSDKKNKKEDKKEEKKKEDEGPSTLSYALGTVVMATVGTILYSLYQKESEKREANLEKMLLVEELLAREDNGLTEETKAKLMRIFENVKKVVSHQKTSLNVNTLGLGAGATSIVGYSLSSSPLSSNFCLLTGTVAFCGLIACNVHNWLYYNSKIENVAQLIQNDVLYLFDKQDEWFLPTEPLISI